MFKKLDKTWQEMKEMHWQKLKNRKIIVRVEDKGSRFVVLNNDDYDHEVEDQINRGSLLQTDHIPTQEFNLKIEKWSETLTKNKSIDDKWQLYPRATNDNTPGKMYDLIKST